MWNRYSVKNSKYRIKLKPALFQKYYGFNCWLRINTFFCYWLMCRTGSSRAVFVFSESVFQINLTSSVFLLSFPSQVFPCYALIEFLSHCSFYWSVREKKMQHPHMGLNILFCRASFFRDVSDSFKVFLVGLLKFFSTFMRIFLFIFIFISIAWGKLNGAPGKVTFLIQIRLVWFPV